MTAIQKTIIATVSAVAAGAIIVSLYQPQQASNLREQLQTLKRQAAQPSASSSQLLELQRERDRATNALAEVESENAQLKKNPNAFFESRHDGAHFQLSAPIVA